MTGARVRVEAEQADRIVALGDVGRRFETVDRDWIEVKAPADARYIRFEGWGRGEKRAWTQPFIVQGAVQGAAPAVPNHPILRDEEWQGSAKTEEGEARGRGLGKKSFFGFVFLLQK